MPRRRASKPLRSALPFTGGPNAKLSLGVLSLEDHSLRWLPWSDDPEAYLARVTWAPGSDALFLQRQPRDQKTLSLLRLGLDGALHLALEERSESWVNLHDDFRPLASGGALWSAERGGPRQLYYRPRLGEAEERRLTPEGSIVHRVLAVDEEAGEVLFEGTLGDPTARQVLRAHFDSSPVEALTEETGWHQGGGGGPRRRLDGGARGASRSASGSYAARQRGHAPGDAHGKPPEQTKPRLRPLPFLPRNSDSRAAPRGRRPAALLPAYQAKGRWTLSHHSGGLRGPRSPARDQGWPPLLHQVFVQHGWAVLELDNRGSAGRGEAFERPIYRTFGAVEVRDQFRALDAFAEASGLTEAEWRSLATATGASWPSDAWPRRPSASAPPFPWRR